MIAETHITKAAATDVVEREVKTEQHANVRAAETSGRLNGMQNTSSAERELQVYKPSCKLQAPLLDGNDQVRGCA